MKSVRFFTILSFIFLIATTVYPQLVIISKENIVVPGLSDAITQFKINDLEGDGHPEILATDGSSAVLYSPLTDSILFQKSLEIDEEDIRFEYKIEFADVNRDQVPDILIGKFWNSNSVQNFVELEGFDGTNDFETLGKLSAEFSTVTGWDASLGLYNLQALDINNDGFNELLFSYDEIHSFMPPIEEMTAGFTHCYYSFPDSTLWISYAPLGPAVFLGSSDSGGLLYTLSYKGTVIYFDDHLFTSRRYRPEILNSNGFFSNMAVALGEASDIVDRGQLYGGMSGDFGFGSLIGDVLMIHGVVNVPGETRSLCMYNINSVDSMDLKWYITGSDLDNLISLPYFKGHLIAKSGNHLSLIQYSDGVSIEESDELPPGSVSWAYPYNDGIPRLLITSENTVSIYTVELATGIEEDFGRDDLPTSFVLGNPFPNPFNAEQTIPITMDQKSFLTVNLYNVLGQNIYNLFEQQVSAGTINISWDASSFSSGVYFIKASTQHESAVVKTILLK